MHMFINALAASAGGGLTYMRNVLPYLASKADLKVTVALNPALRQEFRSIGNVQYFELDIPAGRRFWYEQSSLRNVIRNCRADVLLSTGNFAIRRSPVPQILLSRNSIYVSADFYRDLWRRREYRAWLETRFRATVAKRSIKWATFTVAPSQAFASELERWSGKRVMAIHHGFDQNAFVRNSSALAPELEEKLKLPPKCIKLLFVSHYNYYRNFETLIRALPVLRDRLGGLPFRLLLSCHLHTNQKHGTYNPAEAAALVHRLGLREVVIELGSIPYEQLHHLYVRADAYVTPAYTETFAHPLVEAMASGLPIIASDLSVHREICGEAATYFPKFSSESLAETVAKVVLSPQLKSQLVDAGARRSLQFSWKKHVNEILAVCEQALKSYSEVGPSS